MSWLDDLLSSLGVSSTSAATGQPPTPSTQQQPQGQTFGPWAIPSFSPTQAPAPPTQQAAPTADSTTGGFLGGLNRFLQNPLTQGAAQGFFGFKAAPHGTPGWERFGLGGERALEGYNEAVSAQAGLPMKQAQTLAEQLKTRGLAQQMAPVSPDEIARLRQSAAQSEQAAQAADASKNAEEASYDRWSAMWMNSLADGAERGTLDSSDLYTALQKHDEAKAQYELMGAYQRYQTGATTAAVREPTINILTGGATGGTPGAPGAPAPAAAGGGAYGLPPGVGVPPDLGPDLDAASKMMGFSPIWSGPNQNIQKVGGVWQFKIEGLWFTRGADGSFSPVGITPPASAP